MAVYHLHAKVGSRSGGKSAVASAAYRSGESLEDNEYGVERDYTRKQGIAYTDMIAPAGSPAWATERQELWNMVEATEKRKDAQLYREVEFSLPVELDRDSQIDLVTKFVTEQYVARGMVADIAIHDKKDGNPHCHVMLTTREISPDGFGKKVREWNDKELLKEWRKQWADCANNALEMKGEKSRIDHRTLEAQGIDRLPTVHRGPNRDGELKRVETKLRWIGMMKDIENQRIRAAAEKAISDEKSERAKANAQAEVQAQRIAIERPVDKYNKIVHSNPKATVGDVIRQVIATNDPAICRIALEQLAKREKEIRDRTEQQNVANYVESMGRIDAVYERVEREYKAWEKAAPYEKPAKRTFEGNDNYAARCDEASRAYDQKRNRVIMAIIAEFSREAGISDFNQRTGEGSEHDQWTKWGKDAPAIRRIRSDAQRTVLVDPELRSCLRDIAERPEREAQARERAQAPDRDIDRSGGWGR